MMQPRPPPRGSRSCLPPPCPPAITVTSGPKIWSDDERGEIIDGVADNRSPAPSTRHPVLAGNLFPYRHRHWSGKGCRPLMAPTDVRLSETHGVQPDIRVVEILSPNAVAKELRERKWLYERSGGREYGVVDPLEMYVQRFLLVSEGWYGEPEVFGAEEAVALVVLEGLTMDLREVCEWSPPGSDSGRGESSARADHR